MGSPTALGLLAQLSENEPASFPWERFADTEHADDFRLLISCGALRHCGNTGSIRCTACDSHHSAPVEFRGGGAFRAYCPEAGYYHVQADELRVFELDAPAVAALVAQGLRIPARTPIEEVVPRFLYGLGKQRFGPYLSRIFFARCLDRNQVFDRVRSALGHVRYRSPVLVVATTSWELMAGALPARHAALSLSAIATFDGGALVLNNGACLATLRGEGGRCRGGGTGHVFSSGFRSAVVGDQSYEFTKKQAEVIEMLFGAFETGLAKMHQDEVMTQVGSNQHIGQLFRGHPAYGTLILTDKQGYYWLNL